MADVRDLLVEIGTEELPPKALTTLERALKNGVTEGLTKESLSFGKVYSYATPRRLAVVIEDVATVQPERQTERRGPAVNVAYSDEGLPTKAAQGFARSCGVEVDHLERLKTDAGEWLLFRTTEVAQFSASLLPRIINSAITALPAPKRMRWSDLEYEFVRPVRWLTVIFGSNTLECEVMGLTASNTTRGHRFHCPDPITISAPRDYAQTLKQQGYVVADFAERRQRIEADVRAVAQTEGAQVVIAEDLLDEVTALTEWPVAIAGSFDESFLEVPDAALIATMKANQKYFHLTDDAGNLLPAFITVANLRSSNPSSVRRGNERVIRPRLADAQFFYQTDLKEPLASRLTGLESVVFQRQLGSVADKSRRVSELAVHVAAALGAETETVKSARRAGLLSKCDLATEMVSEFPELQGFMGGVYARAGEESEAVAVAVADVYKPRFAGDALPATLVGQAVAIADKLDTLTGIFGIKQPPTGDRDPFALRRAALGVLRIMIECELDLDLAKLLQASVQAHGNNVEAQGLTATVFDFMVERMRGYIGDQGVSPDVYQAVHARAPARPLDFARRVAAVQAFRTRPEGASLAAANKRIKNILRQADDAPAQKVNDGLLKEDAEWNLAAKLVGLAPRAKELQKKHDYDGALTLLAGLRDPIDAFFESVRVMDDNDAVRANRIALLSSIDALFMQTADISLLQE